MNKNELLIHVITQNALLLVKQGRFKRLSIVLVHPLTFQKRQNSKWQGGGRLYRILYIKYSSVENSGRTEVSFLLVIVIVTQTQKYKVKTVNLTLCKFKKKKKQSRQGKAKIKAMLS